MTVFAYNVANLLEGELCSTSDTIAGGLTLHKVCMAMHDSSTLDPTTLTFDDF